MLKKPAVSILAGLIDNVGPAKAAPHRDIPSRPAVSVLEDDPTLAAIAAELCTDLGADVTIFPAPAACLEAALRWAFAADAATPPREVTDR